MSKNGRRSFLCPNCRRLISSGMDQCPYCNISNPGSWRHNNLISRGFQDPEQLVKIIIYTNAGMFILSLLFSRSGPGLSFNPLSFLSPDNNSLLILGATGTIPINGLHRWWSLVSANYLHGSILHILFNMFAFNQLAPLAIKEFGSHRMFIIYTVGGILGFLVSYFAGVRFTIGASAAVCALMGAILYYGKSRGGGYGRAVYSQISGWVVSLFIFGFLVPGINNWGHGGGLATGALLGFVLGYRERKKESFLHKTLAWGCMFLTAAVLVFSISIGIVSLLL